MKKEFKLSLLVFIICSSSVYSQNSFPGKPKKSATKSTMSIRPIVIDGQASQNQINSSSKPLAAARSFSLSKLQDASNSVVYNKSNGLPIFIESSVSSIAARRGFDGNAERACFQYLNELKPLLQLDNPEQDFRISSQETDAQNKTHFRLEQLHNTVPIYGSEVLVHINELGNGETFNGRYEKIPVTISTDAKFSGERAIEIANTKLNPKKLAFTSPIPLEESSVKLYVYPHKQKGIISYVLAYHVISYSKLHRWEFFIDASTGAILREFDSTCFIDGARIATANDLNNVSRTINTYQVGSTYFLIDASRSMYIPSKSVLPDDPIGAIFTIDMNNTFGKNASFNHNGSANNAWTDKTAVSAHVNAGIAFQYYQTKHGRNSIDGKGGTIISAVRVADSETGKKLDNAFWNGKGIFYGDGDVGFKPLAGAIDVAGHEMTHGVVQNTANLEYEGESGAINESMADVFGVLMDPDNDWRIGEDVVKTSAFPSGALRSMEDPHNGGTSLSNNGFQPKHMNEKYTGTEDNGGVHINSGIPNFAFFKYATAITRDKAASIYYKALKDYLTKSSQFIDLRLAVIKAATDLHGAGANEVTQAGLAFDAVGIVNGTGGTGGSTIPPQDYPVNPGDEFLLVTNTDPGDVNSLYRSSITGTNLQALTKTTIASRPSSTDNGEVAVFVADDGTIHAINVKPGAAPEETVISSEVWGNVVVSKDGTKIAAVTTKQDTAIYVYDFISKKWGKFKLYNPTYTQGVNAAGPVYADGLEWDNTGEYLVYDAFNQIDNNGGNDLKYWDVGFIQVWSNSSNKFGTGTIAKLFASLPKDVNIGNPSFSKLSSSIVAFDYFDIVTPEYAVLAYNIERNKLNTVANNNTLGYPSFNKDDTRLAFATGNGAASVINYVSLNPDKITSTGVSQTILNGGRWPVYFSLGKRNIVTGTEEAKSLEGLSFSCYPNPMTNELNISFGEGEFVNGKVELVNAGGMLVHQSTMDAGEAKINTKELSSGLYVVRVETSKGVGFCKVVK
ncbi:MAG: M4 family metallopeptidase [Cyclobacteriaceae bacterium]